MSKLTREERHARTAEALLDMFEDKPAALLSFLVSQLATVRNQAQAMLGLCGLIITVTGFSGPRMVEAGSFSAYSMVMGIAMTLVAAVVSLWVLINVRWVSHSLHKDMVVTAKRVLERRDRQHFRTTIAGIFVAAGLAFYLIAVSAAAFSGVP